MIHNNYLSSHNFGRGSKIKYNYGEPLYNIYKTTLCRPKYKFEDKVILASISHAYTYTKSHYYYIITTDSINDILSIKVSNQSHKLRIPKNLLDTNLLDILNDLAYTKKRPLCEIQFYYRGKYREITNIHILSVGR